MATRKDTDRWVLDASGMADIHDAPLRKQRLDEMKRSEDAEAKAYTKTRRKPICICGKEFDYGDRVAIELVDGKSFRGVIDSFDPSINSVSGHDEIVIEEPSRLALRLLYVDSIARIDKEPSENMGWTE